MATSRTRLQSSIAKFVGEGQDDVARTYRAGDLAYLVQPAALAIVELLLEPPYAFTKDQILARLSQYKDVRICLERLVSARWVIYDHQRGRSYRLNLETFSKFFPSE